MLRWALAFRLLGLGWYIAFCILGGVAGGYWLDNWLGLRPLCMLIGVVTGSAVAFYGMYRMVLPLLKTEDSHGSAQIENTRDEEHPR
jgi:F0F1-type ATP synthase assembly protein I